MDTLNQQPASRPVPDLTWLCPGRDAARRSQTSDVLLLIEVAHSSLPSDMGEKAELYAEYCVVDVAARCVHVCADAANNVYQDRGKFTTGQILSPRCRPAASLTLSELFTEN